MEEVNEGYEPDIKVSVTDEEIETEYAGYRAKREQTVDMYLPCDHKKDDCLSGIYYARQVLSQTKRMYLPRRVSRKRQATHTKLWVESILKGRASYINEDKPIIRCKDGVWYAYGTVDGKVWSQSSAPIQAVCFIERGEENKINC